MYRNVERYMVEYVHKHTRHISSQDIFIPFNSLLFSGTNIRYDCGKVTKMASLFFVVMSSWHRSDTVLSWLNRNHMDWPCEHIYIYIYIYIMENR